MIPNFLHTFFTQYPDIQDRVNALKKIRNVLPDNFNDPKISITTPSFNQGEFIEITILSILLQPYKNIEYTVFDAGSTDETKSILKAYSEVIDFWVSEPDKGQSDAINKGINYSTGQIFNWINSDDFLEENALLKLAECYNKNRSAFAWIGAVKRIKPDYSIINIVWPNNITYQNMGNNYNGRQFYQPGCFYNLEELKSIGGINEDLHFAMDYNLYLTLLRKGVFVKGEGIWASAIIHSDAKTQKLRDKMFTEVIEIQKKFGFLQAAENRFERHFNKTPRKYFLSDSQNQKGGLTQNYKKYNGKKITIVSNHLLRYDRSSSNLRVSELIKMFTEFDFTIEYFHKYDAVDDQKYIEYLKEINRDISVYSIDKNYAKFFNSVSESCITWITNLWTLNYVEFVAGFLDSNINLIKSKLVIDTMDFHSKKYFRMFELDKSMESKTKAEKFLEFENKIYPLADDVIAVTKEEQKDLIQNIPKIKKSSVIPNIHNLDRDSIIFSETKNICFLGNYVVDHNRDAVYYFIKQIYPEIKKYNPEIEFHLLGSGIERLDQKLIPPDVKQIGYVDDVKAELKKYRVFTCPMIYGAGLKGKIGEAVSAGIPFVSTPIGIEGYNFEDGKHCFIAKDNFEFAHKVIHLYNDSDCWWNFHYNAKIEVDKLIGYESVKKRLSNILSDLIAEKFEGSALDAYKKLKGKS